MNKEQENFLIEFIKAKQNGNPLNMDNSTDAQKVFAIELLKIPTWEIKQFLLDNKERWIK